MVRAAQNLPTATPADTKTRAPQCRAHLGIAIVLCALSLATRAISAQTPAAMVTGPSQPAAVPLSGRITQDSAVSINQRTGGAGGAAGVDVITSTISVQGPYAGSVPGGNLSPNVLSLKLEDALAMGLRANLAALSESAAIQQAEGQRAVALSGLLPTLNAGIAESFERLNLRTLGVESKTFPESSKFNYFDARFRLTQSVLDLVKLYNLQSATENRNASIKAARDARDLIVLAVGGSYLQLTATKARIDATAAEVETSRAIYQQAADRLDAGLAARIDVTRSQVQLQTEQQRLRSLQADFDTQKLRFTRIIGLPPGQAFITSTDYAFSPQTQFTEQDALARATKGRADLQAAAAGVKAAEAAVKAAHAERVPSVSVDANFGAAGTTPTYQSTGVYTVSGMLTVPVFEGGRIRGEVEQAAAALKQRKAEYEDTRAQVDTDVRQAFIQLNAAADQVQLAKSNVDLAHETLTQSHDRFLAGVTDTVELVQAQQAVVQADDDYITAVFEHNLAKLSLARAVGNAEQTLPLLLRNH